MSLLLIDDLGQVWPGDSQRLREAFGSPSSGSEFIAYAVKHLGFVALSHSGASCQMRLRPGFVTRAALEATVEWSRSLQAERVELAIFDRTWKDEIVEARHLVARLAELSEREGESQGLFLSRPLSPCALGDPILAEIFESWPHLIANYSADTLGQLLRQAFDQRFVVVRRAIDQDKFIFDEFGREMYRRYTAWRAAAVGAPIDDQPDRVFGSWVGRLYRDAAERQRPLLEAADVVVHWPDIGRQRMLYQRLLFPLATATGHTLLIGGSFIDPTIDLRASTP